MASCPPAPPQFCPPQCPPTPPPPPPPARPKPNLRGLHWSQTKGKVFQAMAIAVAGGILFYFFVGVPRKTAYREYYRKTDMEELADTMARKGLFQAVPSSE
ncbi:unnamed protein product [Plutella xylostella]|uniref:(diamondback moth) hypothetical protein n=1 Tax=Plutella xylostella TaxID=51655 RepID=A0A8S4F9U2_PLUXY|nr:unnamed protein product [Plutella xylostella]